MCDSTVISWFLDYVVDKPEIFRDKDVLEVGSRDVNGSVRPIIMKIAHPKSYIGSDIVPGKGVDQVVAVENLDRVYKSNSFDVVVSTEMLEHCFDWRVAVANMARVLKVGGYLLITTRSKGYPYHMYPYDFWRFSIEDFRQFLVGFELQDGMQDTETMGIFVTARKTGNSVEFPRVPVYNIAVGYESTAPQRLTLLRKGKIALRKARLLKQVT